MVARPSTAPWKPSNMPLTQQRTAYHEAGHAVVGWLLGFKIVSVRLFSKSSRGASGATKIGRYTERHHYAVEAARQTCPHIEATIAIVCLLAGVQAEARIALDEMVSEGERSFQDDIERISKLLLEQTGCGPADIRRTLEPLISICRRHIENHWPQVDALAKALLADGKIVKAKDIRRILGPRTMPPRKVIFELASADHPRD
jgi:hypothetical protein